MQVIDFIATHGAWSWVVAGLVLLALELVVPGGVLIWLGGAALVTGGLALFVSIFWPLQFVIFGVLALCSIGFVLYFAAIHFSGVQPLGMLLRRLRRGG